MAKLVLQYNIENLSPATASPVEANYNRIEQHINQELLERDGTVAMRGQLRLAGDPVAALDAATKQYVDQILPIGVMMPYGGAAAPPGGMWELCDGTQRQVATYPELFEVLGYAFGGSGGFFNLPATGGRVPVGADAGIARGSTGGSKDSVLPAHAHDMGHGHAGTSSGGHSTSHTHDLQNHTHGASGNTGGQSAQHYHGVGDANYEGFTLWDAQGGGSFGAVGGSSGLGVYGITGYASGDHIHYFSVGTTGPTPNGSGWAQQDHTHATSTPAFAGSTGQAGTSGTNANLQPYVAILYIIRVR